MEEPKIAGYTVTCDKCGETTVVLVWKSENVPGACPICGHGGSREEHLEVRLNGKLGR